VFWIAGVALPLIAGMQSFAINYGYRGMSRTEAFAKAREVVILLAIVEAIGFFIWNTEPQPASIAKAPRPRHAITTGRDLPQRAPDRVAVWRTAASCGSTLRWRRPIVIIRPTTPCCGTWCAAWQGAGTAAHCGFPQSLARGASVHVRDTTHDDAAASGQRIAAEPSLTRSGVAVEGRVKGPH
jgi:hypothetical protein